MAGRVSDDFLVMMLGELREPFERWLDSRGLLLGQVPGAGPNTFIVVPGPELHARYLDERLHGTPPHEEKP